MKIYSTLGILIAILIGSNIILAQEAEEKNEDLHNLFDEISEYEKSLNKNGEIYRGNHPIRIFAPSSDDYKNQLKSIRGFLGELRSMEGFGLSNDDLISLKTMKLKLSGQVGLLKYKDYLIPFNAEGGFYNFLSRAIRRLPFKTEKDFQSYISWLPTYVDFLKGYEMLMREGVEEGVIAPKVIVRNTIKLFSPWANRDRDTHILTSMLKSRPEHISKEKWSEIDLSVMEIMSNDIWPAHDRLLNYIKGEYMDAAYDAPGISNIPDGKEFYEDRVSYYTTLKMSPEEVYNKGHEEVARIKKRLEAIIEELKFEGSFADFLEFLRTDEQFYPKSAQELLSYAAWLSKKAEGQLPRLFSHLYELPFTVEPVPDDIAPTYTAGRYVGGSRDGDRAGIYWVNTYNLQARTLYNMPALTVHEAVPGHHLQNMIAAELEDIPAFRNRFYISAFGEGWGLYSEFLGEEMGMYETPYERFGRYTYEMWRACRLVVDVGLHYKGWTREEAVDFLSSNTALSLHEVNTEIDRYIGWPGQAVSYKIGEITIKDLRSKAETALGDNFDIKEFHYHILKNGSVPLPMLIRVIDQWIEESLQP